jgi:hypothetical protein
MNIPIDKKWYEMRIELLKHKADFLEQQRQVFEINGFEEFANELHREIRFIDEDIEQLSYEMTLKQIDKPIRVFK